MGMPPSWTATAITSAMYPEHAASGPSPVCSTHGASSPCARSDANRSPRRSRADASRPPLKSRIPSRPKRRYALSASPAPRFDHSSVPSTPNARSAFGRNSSSIRRHASPSPAWCRSSSAAFASALRRRNAASPSGNSVPVGWSVLTYSSPWRARSSRSCACAAPPTHSGCHALKTSCRKPGWVISAVLIAPPSQSLRSSTHTRQPLFASSAPQARPLTPLPTTTASTSAIDNRSELVVGDEAPLPRPRLLHLREHVAAPGLGEVDPELLGLDPDRVEPALLPEHDPTARRDELRRVGLDRRRVVELARDRAALAAEQRVAGDGLPRLERIPRQPAHALRHLAHAVELQVRLDAVECTQRKRDLGEVRVACALAHAVDRPVHPGGAGADGGDGARGRDAEVVVPVEVDRHLAPDELDGLADEGRDRLRRRDPERIDHDDLAGSGVDRRGVDTSIEVGLGAARVDAEERGVDPVVAREPHRARDAVEHLVARDADRVELEVGDGRLDHGVPDAELDERLEVGRDGPREPPHLGAKARGRNEPHRLPVVRRDAREPGLDPVDAELVEEPRDLELLVWVQDDADRLLAVAKRRVVQADTAADRVGVVETARPDQVAHATTPSGNDDSFSAAPDVM